MKLFVVLMFVSTLCFGEKINLVIPFAPGGNIDNIARLMIETANKQGNIIIPVYKVGGDGVVGTNYVANKNEENTLLFGSNGPLVYAPLLKNVEVNYDAIKHFTPVILTTKVYSVILTHPSTQIKNLNTLLSMNRKSEKFMFASASPVTIFHLQKIFGKDTLIITHKVASIAMISIATGDIPFGMSTISTALPFIRSGKISPIAVTSPDRLTIFKNVPSISESIHGLEVSTWHGIFANYQHESPNKYYSIFKKVISDQSFKDRLDNLSVSIPESNDAIQLKRLLVEEIKNYSTLEIR
jgi:tripartite-type tricarboxylate transporter receptor subunit TctC